MANNIDIKLKINFFLSEFKLKKRILHHFRAPNLVYILCVHFSACINQCHGFLLRLNVVDPQDSWAEVSPKMG